MADLPARLNLLRPTIEKLMKIGGTPGLSLNVVSKGSQVYNSNFGFRDAEKRLKFTDQTITPVCSMTKAVTAAALGILVEEKKIRWDTLVKDALPSFRVKNEILQNCTTITDLLCHRAGFSWGDNLFIGTENNVLISGQDTIKYLNNQTLLLPFRGQFSYNNIPFEIAGKVIEALSGESILDFVQSRIFDPLGMERTFLKTPPSNIDNVSLCFNVLDDGSPVPIPCVKAGDDWFGSSSAGMRSCPSDLMKLYNAFLKSFNDQFVTGNTFTEGSPLKQVTQLMSAKVPMDQPSMNEASYGLGWGRVQLPGRMGQIGLNPDLMPHGMPTVGKGVPSHLVLYHQGSMPGALAIVILIPKLESFVTVTTNALALNDVPDWVGQLVLEEFLDVPSSERNDYLQAAELSAAENLKWYPTLTKELEELQKNGTSPRGFDEYVGTYWDDIHVFKIVVTQENGSLYWALQGLDSEKFLLNHYEDDSFTWLAPRNELAKRGRWIGGDQGVEFWKADFKANDKGVIDKLYWAHDNGIPQVEYTKV
ncbi:MAG: hypothetical protein M1814_000953 [Vezdaea aestivalis]|nr:MAG: hypothetical protein M1814_000953 [Vezdaea aestivalis]